MARRRRGNPLALAILSTLHEGPSHPYDVAATLKQRHVHEAIRLNYGSLYSVVDNLEADGLIEARETVRSGRRPARTVYAITEAGTRELTDWLSDLVATPQKEYLQFEAALALVCSLPPDDVTHLLRRRLAALDVDLARQRADLAMVRDELGLPRLFALEGEHRVAVVAAERTFVAALLDDLEQGHLDGLDLWRTLYPPPDDPGPDPDNTDKN
ncbi:MAG: PadR family transcriptional regulator [Actinobacteria bacterium]|nr:PadR family transcriptional regulator [Actinomycetota bacterium]